MDTHGVTFCDESDDGFGWIAPEPSWMQRASHALAADGGVWLVDPTDFPGLDERVASLGEPRAVLQLINRHDRDCAAIAARLGVPVLETPVEVPGSPFETGHVPAVPGWKETALWWPERRTLVVSEAVGTNGYYVAPGQAVGINPLLRLLRPPTALLRFAPEHLLCSHGAGVHERTAEALQLAVGRARRDIPRVVQGVLKARRS